MTKPHQQIHCVSIKNKPILFSYTKLLCARLSWLLVSCEVHIKSLHIIIIIILYLLQK